MGEEGGMKLPLDGCLLTCFFFLCFRSPGAHPSAANGHEVQPDLLPASLEYRLEGESQSLFFWVVL